MKTQNDILTIVYTLVKASPINALAGEIYINIRKTGIVLEDCVISLINGTSGKFLQYGALSVKVFYNDLNVANSYAEDTKRGGELETLLQDLSTVLLKNPTVTFEIQSRETYTARLEEQNQHYAILKMNFQIT